jgi:hypothetical protein
MTDEQINQRIAEACGWTDFVVHPEFGLMGTPPDTHGLRTAVDYYTVDLNAMHEAEKTLSETNMFVMAHHIERFVSRHGQHYFHATARQRAEAFLRTLGKWDDQFGDVTEMVREVQK